MNWQDGMNGKRRRVLMKRRRVLEKTRHLLEKRRRVLAKMKVELLMLIAQQIVDGLDGIEGAEGNFYENRIPVAHSSVP